MNKLVYLQESVLERRYKEMKSILIGDPNIKTNFPTVVDHFGFSARSSDIIKAAGPEYLFRELEDRCIVDIQKGPISELRPLIEIFEKGNCLSNSKFFSFLEDLDGKEGKDEKHKAVKTTDFSTLVQHSCN